jgi:protein-L-isoaspartate(D-aspartate) O-methyltransferase
MTLKSFTVFGIILTFSGITATEMPSSRQEAPPDVVAAFDSVKREDFLPEENKHQADQDKPIPIGHGQTTSQPSLLMDMVSRLCIKKTDRLLEVGTGSGYLTAVLSLIVQEVYTLERIPQLYDEAIIRLNRLGFTNIKGRCQSGEIPWGDGQIFDVIIVSAACEEPPPALIDQLAPGGRMLIPLGKTPDAQMLTMIEKDADGKITQTELYRVRFVPFITDETTLT